MAGNHLRLAEVQDQLGRMTRQCTVSFRVPVICYLTVCQKLLEIAWFYL
jgi:hypothetical protein